MATHDVFNQVPDLVNFNTANFPMVTDTLTALGASADDLAAVLEVGAAGGSAEVRDLADLAEEHQPVLHTHDRFGNRVDRVTYDPSYHELMRRAVGYGLHGSPWLSASPTAHLERAAKMSVWTADPGHLCPISMTYAIVPALRANPELYERFSPLLGSREYDPALVEPTSKVGLIAGMSMTEKQGGSDVRANTTRAVRSSDGSYRITGHKWFTSAPMSDLFLTLAQTDAGVACFLVPRILPDGTANAFALQRLKNKLGNHSNASSEVEYDNTLGWLVGEEGRGVRTIIEMVNMTRLDCALMSGSLMRTGVVAAAHHARHRSAFGRPLSEQPLMRNVLSDLAVEAEAATITGLWLAALTDRSANGDADAAELRRIALSISKYYICKRAPFHAAEALECFGGNGYVEDSRMPRLYREAPLLSIWEGSGNVAALDTLRAVAKQPQSLEAIVGFVESANDSRLSLALKQVLVDFEDVATIEFAARRVVGTLAQLLQATLLAKYGSAAVAEAFVASRIDGNYGNVYGTLSASTDTAEILSRVFVD